MPRTSIRITFRILLLVLFGTSLALAVGANPNSGQIDRAEIAAVRPAAAGLKTEIASIIEDRAAAVAELRAEFDAAPSDEEALRIMRRIEAAMYRAETALLEAQIPWAEKRGDTVAVERLEKDLAILRDTAPTQEVER